jgi:hypothetical protein
MKCENQMTSNAIHHNCKVLTFIRKEGMQLLERDKRSTFSDNVDRRSFNELNKNRLIVKSRDSLATYRDKTPRIRKAIQINI